jgi:hypothetical protein
MYQSPPHRQPAEVNGNSHRAKVSGKFFDALLTAMVDETAHSVIYAPQLSGRNYGYA